MEAETGKTSYSMAPQGRHTELYRLFQSLSSKLIPAVGMRIVADFEREEAEIVRFVEQVSLHVVSCPSPLARADGPSLEYRCNVKTAKTTLLVNFVGTIFLRGRKSSN